MESAKPVSAEARERRLALAQKAFRDFYGICFWWFPPDFEVTESSIPLVIQELRSSGGHAGYRIVAELCRQVVLKSDRNITGALPRAVEQAPC